MVVLLVWLVGFTFLMNRSNLIFKERAKLIEEFYGRLRFLIGNDFNYYLDNFSNRDVFSDYYSDWTTMLFYFWRYDFHNMLKHKNELLFKRMKDREIFIKQQMEST